MSLVRIEALRVETRKQKVLIDGLNLDLHPGERLGIVGESGSGKSLAALCVMGLTSPDLLVSGKILLSTGDDFVEVVSASESTLNSVRGSKVSIVFQEPGSALDPMMKISKQLSLVIRKAQGLNRAAAEVEVIRALNEVQITDPRRVANSYPHQISGGEKQRVAIALALACRPSLLIADEPTTSLDVSVQAGIIQLLDKIVENRKMALIFISHDLAVVSQVVNRVMVLREGVCVESTTTERLISSPAHPYTKELVSSARRLDQLLDSTRQGRGGVDE
jgi:peptide/nickel transport system ATP-binding protein